MHHDEISRIAPSDFNGCVTKLITRLKNKKLDSGKALYVRNLPGDTAKEANYRWIPVSVKGQSKRNFKALQQVAKM